MTKQTSSHVERVTIFIGTARQFRMGARMCLVEEFDAHNMEEWNPPISDHTDEDETRNVEEEDQEDRVRSSPDPEAATTEWMLDTTALIVINSGLFHKDLRFRAHGS